MSSNENHQNNALSAFNSFPTELKYLLLVVVGEPFSEENVDLVLKEIEKGLKNWDINADETEYEAVLQQAVAAEVKRIGLVQKSFSCAGSHLGIVVLINPTLSVVSTELQQLLVHPATFKHIIYGGLVTEGTGDWMLHDDTLTLTNVGDVFADPQVSEAIQKQEGEKPTLIVSNCHWSSTVVAKQAFSKNLNVTLNPPDVHHDIDGVTALVDHVKSQIVILTPFELLEPPNMGVSVKCKINKPTVLVLPASKGDCGIFAVSDFSVLIGGGYSVKSCFWKFAKHLNRIDAILQPNMDPNSLLGVNSFLQRKLSEMQLEQPEGDDDGFQEWQTLCNSPELGVIYLNAPPIKKSPAQSVTLKSFAVGSQTVKLAKEIGCDLIPCVASSGKVLEPVTLYQKVGIGRLDMYVLSPTQGSKDLKDFFTQWSSGKSFTKVKTGVKVNDKDGEVPLLDAVSICALIVWQPWDKEEDIIRILFPGNAPQNRIMEGLDKLKHLDFLKYREVNKLRLQNGGKPVIKKKTSSAKPKPNGPIKKIPSPAKEVCEDGIHCNTPPPSPTEVCADGVSANSSKVLHSDDLHCNTTPPEGACTDGEHCNTPPPEQEGPGVFVTIGKCEDGQNCNTPPPEEDGFVPIGKCEYWRHCNTPPPDEQVCTDGENCNMPPPPEGGCSVGIHCITPPPEGEDDGHDDEASADPLDTTVEPTLPKNVLGDGDDGLGTAMETPEEVPSVAQEDHDGMQEADDQRVTDANHNLELAIGGASPDVLHDSSGIDTEESPSPDEPYTWGGDGESPGDSIPVQPPDIIPGLHEQQHDKEVEEEGAALAEVKSDAVDVVTREDQEESSEDVSQESEIEVKPSLLPEDPQPLEEECQEDLEESDIGTEKAVTSAHVEEETTVELKSEDFQPTGQALQAEVDDNETELGSPMEIQEDHGMDSHQVEQEQEDRLQEFEGDAAPEDIDAKLEEQLDVPGDQLQVNEGDSAPGDIHAKLEEPMDVTGDQLQEFEGHAAPEDIDAKLEEQLDVPGDQLQVNEGDSAPGDIDAKLEEPMDVTGDQLQEFEGHAAPEDIDAKLEEQLDVPGDQLQVNEGDSAAGDIDAKLEEQLDAPEDHLQELQGDGTHEDVDTKFEEPLDVPEYQLQEQNEPYLDDDSALPSNLQLEQQLVQEELAPEQPGTYEDTLLSSSDAMETQNQQFSETIEQSQQFQTEHSMETEEIVATNNDIHQVPPPEAVFDDFEERDFSHELDDSLENRVGTEDDSLEVKVGTTDDHSLEVVSDKDAYQEKECGKTEKSESVEKVSEIQDDSLEVETKDPSDSLEPLSDGIGQDEVSNEEVAGEVYSMEERAGEQTESTPQSEEVEQSPREQMAPHQAVPSVEDQNIVDICIESAPAAVDVTRYPVDKGLEDRGNHSEIDRIFGQPEPHLLHDDHQLITESQNTSDGVMEIEDVSAASEEIPVEVVTSEESSAPVVAPSVTPVDIPVASEKIKSTKKPDESKQIPQKNGVAKKGSKIASKSGPKKPGEAKTTKPVKEEKPSRSTTTEKGSATTQARKSTLEKKKTEGMKPTRKSLEKKTEVKKAISLDKKEGSKTSNGRAERTPTATRPSRIGVKPATTKPTGSAKSTPTKKSESQRPGQTGKPSGLVKRSGETTARTTATKTTRTTRVPSGKGESRVGSTKKPTTTKAAAGGKTQPIPVSGPAIYVDLAYIPNHGAVENVNSEFFRRIQSRYYVMSGDDKSKHRPNIKVLQALLEGKLKCEENSEKTTLIPTHDVDCLREWQLNNHEEISKANIEIASSASRSIVQMRDENFFMYKVEFDPNETE